MYADMYLDPQSGPKQVHASQQQRRTIEQFIKVRVSPVHSAAASPRSTGRYDRWKLTVRQNRWKKRVNRR
jgi:hypothetical protein